MDSLSKTSLESDPTEERFPLLLLLLEDGSKLKGSGQDDEPSRFRSVARGAASLMSRWPCHILSVVLIALVIAVISLVTLLIMTIMSSLITGQQGVHVYWKPTFHPPLNIRSLGESCQDYIINENRTSYNHVSSSSSSSGFKTVDFVPSVLSNTTTSPANTTVVTPFSTHMHEAKQHRIFFVYIDAENISSHHVCSIESAAKLNPNMTCYIMIIHKTEWLSPTVKNKNLTSLAEVYNNIRLINVNGEDYFATSPLYGLWKHCKENTSVIKFAARVITLWQYGGINYDFEVLTLNQTAAEFLINSDEETAMMDMKQGLIMSVRQLCHAFLYELMKMLSTLTYSLTNEKEFSVGKVIAQTLVQFCNSGKVTFLNDSISVNYTCHGIKKIPDEMFCHNYSENNDCLWTTAELPRNSSCMRNTCPTSLKVP
ncbi:uncharacterized protein [Anabrus simplex]|uniref:uncharacterized protein n=1 Tax=Anabrus simplex TaxID=316456 RepID=UPI0035A32890